MTTCASKVASLSDTYALKLFKTCVHLCVMQTNDDLLVQSSEPQRQLRLETLQKLYESVYNANK